MMNNSSGAMSNSSSAGTGGNGNQYVEPSHENRSKEAGVHAAIKSNCSNEVDDVKAAPESDVRHAEGTEDTFTSAVQPQHEGNTAGLYTAAKSSAGGSQQCELQSGINGAPTDEFQGQAPTQSGTSKEETLAAYQQPEQQISNPGRSIPHSQSQESSEQHNQEVYSSHADRPSLLDSRYSSDLLCHQTESAEKRVYAEGRRQLHGQVSDTGDDNEPQNPQSPSELQSGFYSSEQEHCENIKHLDCYDNSSGLDKRSDLSEHQLDSSTQLLSHTKQQYEHPLQEQTRQQHPLLESDQQQPSGQLIQQDPSQRSLYSQDQKVGQTLPTSSQQEATQEMCEPDQSEEACIPDSSQHALYQQDPLEPAAVQNANQQAPAQHAVYQEDYPTHQGTPPSHTAYQSSSEQVALQTPSEYTAQQEYATCQQGPSQEGTYQRDPSQQAAYQQDPSQQAAYQQDPSQQGAYQQDPSQEGTYQQDPSQQVAYQQDPSQQVAYEQDPSQQAAYQQDPSQQAAYEQDPSQQAAYEQDPSQQDTYQQSASSYQQNPSHAMDHQDPSQHATYYQQDPSQQTAYQQDPSQQAAYQQDPSQQTAYQQDPSQQAAYQQDPSQQAAYQQDPSQQAAYQQDPSQQGVYQQDPSQQTAYQQDPSQQAAYQQDPSQQAAYQQDPSQQAAYHQDPSQQAAYQQDPSQQAAYQQDPSQQAAYQQDPSQQAAYQQDPLQQAAYQQDPSQQAAYQQDPSQQDAYHQDPSQQAAYQQDPSQQAAYQQDPSQQAAYQQDPSQQAAYQQDPSQQAAYQQDPSQQGVYQQDPSQQGVYQQDPSQQGVYQHELYQHGSSQNVTYQQDRSQQTYEHQVSQHEAYHQDPLQYQQDPSQYAPYQQQQEAYQQGSSQHELYSQGMPQQAAYHDQQEYPQSQPRLYQQDPAEQGRNLQDPSQHEPGQQMAPQSVYQQHHSLQQDLPQRGALAQVVTPQHRAYPQEPSQQFYFQHTQTQQPFRDHQQAPSHGGYQQDSMHSFQQPGQEVPPPQQQAQAATSQGLLQHGLEQSYQQNESYNHTQTEQHHTPQCDGYHSSSITSASMEYSNSRFHREDSHCDDQYSTDAGYHFQYYKTNDPRPPVWKNDAYASQNRSVYPQDSRYMSDSNSPLDPSRKIQPYGSPHESHNSGSWKGRVGKWSEQERLSQKESNLSLGPRTGYNTPPSHSWPSPASTSSNSSIGKHSPGYSSPSQMQPRGSPLHSDRESPTSHLPESQQTKDCHSPKKASGSSGSKEEPGKTPSVFSNQLHDPRRSHSQAGNKHYTNSPKYSGFHETANRRTAMLKRHNWKHSGAPKTKGPQLIDPHFKTTEKKSDPVHPGAGLAAPTKKSLSNFKIPKHKATSSEVSTVEVSGTGKKSKGEGEKCKPAVTVEDKAVDNSKSTTQAPKKSSDKNIAVSETVEHTVQKRIPAGTKASGSGDKKAAPSTSQQRKKPVRDKPEVQQSTLRRNEKAHVSLEKTVPVTGGSPRDIAAILSSLDTSSLQALSISIQQTLTAKATSTKSHRGTASDISTRSGGSDRSETTQKASVAMHPVTLQPTASASVASTAEGIGTDPTQNDTKSNAQSESVLLRPQSHSHIDAQKCSGVVLATVLHSETTDKVMLSTTSKSDCVTSSERHSDQVIGNKLDSDGTPAQRPTTPRNDTLNIQCKLQLTPIVDCSVPHPPIHRSTVSESIAKQSNGVAAINPATPPVSTAVPKDSGQNDNVQSSAGECAKQTSSDLDLSDFYDPRYTYKEYNLRRRPQLADMSVQQPAIKKRKVTISNTQGTEQGSSTQAVEVEQVSGTREVRLGDSQSAEKCNGSEKSKPEVLKESQDVKDELKASKVFVQSLPSFQKERSHHKSAFQILEDDKRNVSLEGKSTSTSVNPLSESQAHLRKCDVQAACEIRQDKARPKISSKKRLQVKKCRNQQSKDTEHNSGGSFVGTLCSLCKQKAEHFDLGFVFGPYKHIQGLTSKCHSDNEQSKVFENPDLVKHDTTHRAKTQVTCESTSTSTEQLELSTVELWVHEECAVWAPGVCLVGNELKGLSEAVSDSANRLCSSCGIPGATLGCGSRGCKNVYHYPCARQTGSTFLEDQFLVFCPKHKEVK